MNLYVDKWIETLIYVHHTRQNKVPLRLLHNNKNASGRLLILSMFSIHHIVIRLLYDSRSCTPYRCLFARFAPPQMSVFCFWHIQMSFLARVSCSFILPTHTHRYTLILTLIHKIRSSSSNSNSSSSSNFLNLTIGAFLYSHQTKSVKKQKKNHTHIRIRIRT